MTSTHARAVVARLTRYRLAAVAAAALLILATTGVVLAGNPGPTQYTGCLNRTTGIPYNVQSGPRHSMPACPTTRPRRGTTSAPPEPTVPLVPPASLALRARTAPPATTAPRAPTERA